MESPYKYKDGFGPHGAPWGAHAVDYKEMFLIIIRKWPKPVLKAIIIRKMPKSVLIIIKWPKPVLIIIRKWPKPVLIIIRHPYSDTDILAGVPPPVLRPSLSIIFYCRWRGVLGPK